MTKWELCFLEMQESLNWYLNKYNTPNKYRKNKSLKLIYRYRKTF